MANGDYTNPPTRESRTTYSDRGYTYGYPSGPSWDQYQPITTTPIRTADEALSFVTRVVNSPAPVILTLIIAGLGYALWRRELKYIRLAKKYARAKAVMTGQLMRSENISALEAEQRVRNHLETKSSD